MNLVAFGKFLVALAGFGLLWCGFLSLRRGPVLPLVRALTYCCGFWLAVGALFMLTGVK